jgi:hypothetical protein
MTPANSGNAITFAWVAAEYLDKVEKEGRAPATMKKLRWLVAQIERDFGDRPIRQIEAPYILRSLRKVEANGTCETTSRLRSIIGSIFRFAVATGRARPTTQARR